MRKKLLFGIIATTMALSMIGCSKDSDNSDKKEEATQTAEATKEAAKESEDKNDDSDKVGEKEQGAREEQGATDENGNEKDTTNKPETPSLDDYPEGAYVAANGSICIDENGETLVLWYPDENIDKELSEHIKKDEEANDPVYTPTFIQKESGDIVVIDDSANVIETLDSTDKDYIDVYKVMVELLETTCLTTDKEEMRRRLIKQRELSTDTIEWKSTPDTYDYDSVTANEEITNVAVMELAFNKEKTGCRMKIYSEYKSNGEEQDPVNAWFNFTKINGKWFYAYEDDYPVLSSYIVAQ